jgi:hypothetical protein
MTDWFIGPGGSDAAAATSFATRRLTFTKAWNDANVVAGDTVWFCNGLTTFTSTRSLDKAGTAGNPITYRALVPGVDGLQQTGGLNQQMIQAGFSANASYLDFLDLIFDGNSLGQIALQINCLNFQNHHIRFLRNRVKNCTTAGFSTVNGGDYFTVAYNTFWRTGVVGGSGWSSAVSINNSADAAPLDSYTGFHHFICNNMISGSYDPSTHHTEGNAIILDIRVGSTLIANNLLFENGRAAIHIGSAKTGAQIWVVNNTCWKNGLDETIGTEGGAAAVRMGEIVLQASTTWNPTPAEHFILNNITQAWAHPATADRVCFYQANDWFNVNSPHITYAGNVCSFTSPAGLGYGVPGTLTSDANKFRQVDPLLINPPVISDSAGGQWASALDPVTLTDEFKLQSGTSIRGIGVDPRWVGSPNANIVADLNLWLLTDLAGVAR